MTWYLTGLLLDGERKSLEPMAQRLVDDPAQAEGMRQRLQQCVAISDWADEEVRRRLAMLLQSRLEPEAFVIDDTGFPKKGRHSVGVARQYSGTLGRIDNCQVAASLHLAADGGSGCIGMRLYLSEQWASDLHRRKTVGVPDSVVFAPKWTIALDLLDDALRWGLAARVTIADAGYGDSSEFRDGLVARGCNYVVGISANHTTWPVGSRPRVPARRAAAGRPASRFRDGARQPISLARVGETLTYRRFSCRDARGGKKTGLFAFARVQLAEKRTKGRPPSKQQWLICEWRPGNDEYKYYVSDLPASTPKRELMRFIKLRWRVERDYQEMKGELGLDHFEGRTWRGFHHHVTLCAVAHGFLAIHRQLFSPKDSALDVPDGSPSHAAAAHAAHRHLPAVPAHV